MQGVLPLAQSLDTLGFFTHSPGDMAALWRSIGKTVDDVDSVVIGVPDPAPEVESPMAAAFDHAISVMRSAGAKTVPVDISSILAQLADAARTVLFYEGARNHAKRYQQYGEQIGELAALVREGLQMSPETYFQSRELIARSRDRIAAIYRNVPIIAVPAATGPAPMGLTFTGDTRMNSPWTALGSPAITIPMTIDDGLPLGLQFTANRNCDAQLLGAAVAAQRMLVLRI